MKSKAIPVILVTVVIVGLIYVLGSENDTHTGQQTDVEAIKAVIETGFRRRGEACTEANHPNIAASKSEMEYYWSSNEPYGDELSTREAEHVSQYPTVNPTTASKIVTRAETQVAAGIISQSSYSATIQNAYFRSTPVWEPEDSPLEVVRRQIDVCQSRYGGAVASVGFGLESETYDELIIEGDSARAEVRLAYWSDFKKDGDIQNGTFRREVVERWTFYLVKDINNNAWRIKEDFSNAPPNW